MKKIEIPDSRIISYLTLRKLLGGLGIALPVILPAGDFLFGDNTSLQQSISYYYYTNMGDVFVGVLWSFGLFLITYKGYKPDKTDRRLSDNAITNVAGVLAICVALFPINSDINCYQCNPVWVGTFHLVCAATFFWILCYLSLFKFTKSNIPKAQWKTDKKRRNIVYIVCGTIIWTSMLILFLYFMFFKGRWPATVVFWLEAFSLLAFGTSWLTKGLALRKFGL